MARASETCLIRDCKRPRKTRGLCEACYRAACRLVAAKRTDWAEIETMGLALHAARGAKLGPFLRSFHAASNGRPFKPSKARKE